MAGHSKGHSQTISNVCLSFVFLWCILLSISVWSRQDIRSGEHLRRTDHFGFQKSFHCPLGKIIAGLSEEAVLSHSDLPNADTILDDGSSLNRKRQDLLGGLLGGPQPSATGQPPAAQPSQAGQAPDSNPLGALGGLLGGGSGTNGSSPLGDLGGLLSNGLGDIGNGLAGDLAGPALFLGIGLGMGTASGLNLSDPQQAQAVAVRVATDNGMNSTGINAVAQNLGNGLASAAVPLVASNATTGALGSSVGPAVFSLAQGIGNGTASGLGLAQAPVAMSNGSGIADIAGNFGLGVSEPIARSINISNLAGSGLGANFNLPATLEAAGQGLGQGAAQGLGVTKANAAPPAPPAPAAQSGIDFPSAAQGFTRGLTSSFLETANTTLITSMLGSAVPGGGNFQVSRVAEGLARGLVDGAVNGASAAGGIGNLINGNVTRAGIQPTPDTPAGPPFNDSVNGASVAFGRGLANEGVLLVGDIISKKRTGSAKAKRTDLAIRIPDSAQPIINSSLLSFAAQQGVGALQCDGIGGLVSVALGLAESKTISTKGISSFKLDNSTASLLPSGPSFITLDGNTFDFDLQNIGSARVNGLSIVQFAVMLVLHMLLVVAAFFFALPLFLILNSAQRISILLDKPALSIKSDKWQKRIIFFAYLPLAVLGTIFGFIGMGNSQQLRTSHGVIGFITIVMALISGVVYFIRMGSSLPFDSKPLFPLRKLFRNPPRLTIPLVNVVLFAVVIQGALLSFITGWADLRTFTLCFAQALLMLPTSMFLSLGALTTMIGAVAVVVLRFWIERRIFTHVEIIDPEASRKTRSLDEEEMVSEEAKILEVSWAAKQDVHFKDYVGRAA